MFSSQIADHLHVWLSENKGVLEFRVYEIKVIKIKNFFDLCDVVMIHISNFKDPVQGMVSNS